MKAHQVKLLSIMLVLTLTLSIFTPFVSGAEKTPQTTNLKADVIYDNTLMSPDPDDFIFSEDVPFIKVEDENGVHFYGPTGDLKDETSEETANTPKRDKAPLQMLSLSTADEMKNLSDAVDLSQTKYFPAIGNQGGLGACCVWASVYYQFSYELNKLENREAVPENCASVKFVFNFINGSYNNGTTPEQNYMFLRDHGVPSSVSVPYDENYTDWNGYEGIWREALSWRLESYHPIDDIGDEEHRITSPDDPDLYEIKKLLNDGKVLTYSTFIYSWETKNLKKNPDAPENDKFENEYVVTRHTGANGAHRMTLVGYNDNIWTDINDNNKVDEGEMGAFKIANSWGDGYANKGFIWIAYDAMNEISCVEGTDQTERIIAMESLFYIDVKPVSDKEIYFEFTLNAKDRRQTEFTIYAEKDGTVYSRKVLRVAGNSDDENNYSYNGTKEVSEGIFAMDVDTLIPDISPENFGDYKFYIDFSDSEADKNPTTLKDVKVINEYRGEAYSAKDTLPVSLDGEAREILIKDCENTNKTIYYIGYDSPTLHYKDGDSEWKTATMDENIERIGSNRKFVVKDSKDDVLLYFSDDKGNIDDNNGEYYKATDRLNYFRTNNVREPLKVTHFGFANGEVDLTKYMKFDIRSTGGYEPYEDQYIIENLETGEVRTYDYNYPYEKGHHFYNEGKYRITGYIRDQAGDESYISFDLDVVDKPFIFSSFTVTPDELLFAGDPLTLHAKSEFENIKAYGPFHSEYEVLIKDSSGKLIFRTVKRNDKREPGDKYDMGNLRSENVLVWTPHKADTYTATISSTDGKNQYAEKSVSFTVLDKLYGDADADGIIKIKDATLVQKFAASLIGENDIRLETADCSSNDEVNVIDATLIQKYLASFDNTGITGKAITYPEPPEPVLPTEPETEPETEVPTEPTKPVDPPKNTVTFSNSFRWSGIIYCYYWSDTNTSMVGWPGSAMKFKEVNTYGEDVYTFDLPSDVTYIIFSNGTTQTVDIPYPGGEMRYYPIAETDEKGHNKVNTW